MSHVVSGKLRKAPFIKDGTGKDGCSRMYVVELSEVIKDFKTGQNRYTNYSATFFASSDKHKEYYDKAFSEGAFIVVYAEKLDLAISDCKGYIKARMENARLESCMFDHIAQPMQSRNQIPHQHQSTDDDIPF